MNPQGHTPQWWLLRAPLAALALVACQGEDPAPQGTPGNDACSFDVDLVLPVASVHSAGEALCSKASTYDGTANVDSVAADKVVLSFGEGCEFTLVTPTPPTLATGTSVWLTWRQGFGQPTSGESHHRFALRAAQNGPLLLASQSGNDSAPATALEDAADLGLHLGQDDAIQCTQSLGAFDCYDDVSMVYHALTITADEVVVVPSATARDVSIDGNPYVFAGMLSTSTGVRRENCYDGGTLSGTVAWVLTQRQ